MKKTIYTGNIKLSDLKYHSDTLIWNFQFEETIYLATSDFWRYFKNNKIYLISSDNGKKYSFDKPIINLEDELKNELKNELLKNIKLNRHSDLILDFGTKKIIFYVSSTAFENWNLHVLKKQFICMQNCDIVIFDNDKLY